MDGKILVEELLAYAKSHLFLNDIDCIYLRNILLTKFNLDSPYKESNLDFSKINNLKIPDELVNKISEYALENNLVKKEYLNNFITDIFGILTPLPSKINETFNEIKNNKGPQKACDYLYNISIFNNYIQKTAIEKNIKWKYDDFKNNNYLEITINLSKPEKNNKDIANLLTKKVDKKYPLCLLCKENEGFYGTLTHPARQNIRTIKIKLNNENWFMQYSPYAYYDEHCIVINENHHPMQIDSSTPIKLFDFVDFLPNYFIGSNASLPIVGGSILNHEHYQGGLHLMPMHHAKIKYLFTNNEFNDLKIGILDWYSSAIQIEGTNKEKIISLAQRIINTWEHYDDIDNEIIFKTNNTPHNTITPILRKENNIYKFTLILRNNRTNEEYPDGIFHVHPEYQNIKKEGIGLIEAMGLFILPGRLKRQLSEIEEIILKNSKFNIDELNNPSHDLYVHKDMIKKLFKNGPYDTKEKANIAVQNYVNETCVHILENTAVFKNNEKGIKGFEKFLNILGLEKLK